MKRSVPCGNGRGSLTLSNRLQSSHAHLAMAGGMDVGNFIHELLRWSLTECKSILKTDAFHLKMLEKIELLMPPKMRAQSALVLNAQELRAEHVLVDELVWATQSGMTKLVFNLDV
jgi:uncharacterized protein YoaH (UPF0181 family)